MCSFLSCHIKSSFTGKSWEQVFLSCTDARLIIVWEQMRSNEEKNKKWTKIRNIDKQKMFKKYVTKSTQYIVPLSQVLVLYLP